ncbi:MAG TPA: hypothetical protein VG406_21875 [Isosphaeraceae bacterium]|jgi:hypothetical protein|nr:hypothetical protein [Isosphaeraceae bacterium]
MTLKASEFAGLRRDPRWENALARDLRTLSESERFRFLDELLSVQPTVALGLARRCLSQKASFEAILERGLGEADASSIRDWLACVTPHLGMRRVIRRLRELLPGHRAMVKAAAYWLPEFLKGSGCSEADLKWLAAA